MVIDKIRISYPKMQNYLIVGISETNALFPFTLWDALTPQASIPINLMYNFMINPKLSVRAQKLYQFDFNRTPLVLPGCKYIFHESPSNRRAWTVRSAKDYHIAPALKHHRCCIIARHNRNEVIIIKSAVIMTVQ